MITISPTKSKCEEDFEIARMVLTRNGEIFESECGREERLLVLSTNERPYIPKIILYPGEYFISLKKLKFK